MLHACVQRFDVTENLEKFCKILGTKHAPCLDELGLVVSMISSWLAKN
jgi:hypothetical protein